MKPIDIHVVSWHRPKMTELLVKTIRRNTKPRSYRTVVLDNGSDKSTQDHLEQLAENGFIDELIMFKENKGLEYARQYMFKMCALDDEFFICADNDCLPSPPKNRQDWVERLAELMYRYEDYAAIACRTQVMIGTGNIFESNTDLVDFPHPGGSLRIMRTSAVKEVGGWDDHANGRGAEERKIGKKLNDAGYKTAFASKINTLHLFGPKSTDRWGYPKKWKPEDTGHSDIWHPALEQGDDIEMVKRYAGEEFAFSYFDAN